MAAPPDVSPAGIRARQKEQRETRYMEVYTTHIYPELTQRLIQLPENAAGKLAGQYRREMYVDKHVLEWLAARLAADFPGWTMTPSCDTRGEFNELVVQICEG
jgi:hypothetical protein